MAKGRTEIASLGEFGLIDRLTSKFSKNNKSTICGVGDDAAVIEASKDKAVVVSTDSMLEGIDFDLTYFPPKHLGYKVVTKGISDVVAMNAVPEQITLALGISSKISVEFLDDFYEGVEFACKEAGVDLVGGDTSASMTGFVINITAVGRAKKSEITYRSGAKEHDLICLTGNLGASYMGLRLLERERRVLQGVEKPQPKFDGYEYLLQRYLKPRARYDMVESLRKEGIVPTSMIDITDGLASEVLQICKASKCGARIYLERMPLAKQTTALAEEMNMDPVVAALNGGEDYELLFTVPLDKREQIMALGCIDIIGHITAESTGAYLVTPDGNDIALQAQGFTPKEH
ncbi:MAG: thiamine-phosphate kinase [Rikenellaceae bacterium]|nr:thiamine-phosphate kinase [Rikenellaceae bacterium]